MGRTVVNRVSQPRSRKASDYLIVAGAAAIVLFALVGVVSAAAFLADKVSVGTSKPPPRVVATSTSNGNSAAIQDLARAQAQATAIVHTAQQTSRAIVAGATTRANRRAASIIAIARRRPVRVRVIVATPAPAAANVVPAAPPTSVVSSGIGATGINGQTANLGVAGNQSTTGAGSSLVHSSAPPSASVPDLRAVPASWLVVGYNATFGSGPGSAGSISVTNRSGKLFSGVAQVAYGKGGSASAPFANLAPGQTEVLPLNGPAYPGGGYHIVMNVR